MKQLFADPSALTTEQIVACRDALRKLAESPLTRLMCRGFKEAHNNSNLSPTDFWRNLFVTTNNVGPNNSCDPLMRQNRGKGILPNTPPADPYRKLDLQCCVKFLYFGGSRSLDRQNVLPDTAYVLQYFGCSTALDAKGCLDGPYGALLNQMKNIRNGVFSHSDEDTEESLTLDDMLKARDIMCQVLKPFCDTAWTGQEEAKALRRKIDKVFYQKLLPVTCDLGEVFHLANIPADRQVEAQRLMEMVGYVPSNGTLTLDCHPMEFVKQLASIFPLEHLPIEVRAAMMKSILPENLTQLIHSFIIDEGDESLENFSTEALEELSDKGNADAQFELGWRYWENDDDENAIAYFRLAANAFHTQAQYQLGYALKYGFGQWDPKDAVFWLRQATSHENADALYELGDCYERGYGITKDLKKAYDAYDRAAKQKLIVASLAKGRCLIYGIGTEPDVDEGLFLYEKFVMQDFRDAYRLMGQYYANTDMEKALEYYYKAAEKGDAEAHYLIYQQLKQAGTAEEAQLEEHLKKAADGGHPQAQYLWGKTHGLLWMVRFAAQSGHLESCEYLSSYFAGSTKDAQLNESIRYGKLALEMGSSVAQYALAEAYRNKIGNYLQSGQNARNKDIDAAISFLRNEQNGCKKELSELFLFEGSPYYDLYAASDYFEATGYVGKAVSMWIQKAFADRENAEEYAKNAVDLAEKHNMQHKFRIYMGVANALRDHKKISQALSYYLKVVKYGSYEQNAAAQYELYFIYRDGAPGVEPNIFEARRCLSNAANKNHPAACHLLARLHEDEYQQSDDPTALSIACNYYGKAAENTSYEKRAEAAEAYDRLFTKYLEVFPPLTFPKK